MVKDFQSLLIPLMVVVSLIPISLSVAFLVFGLVCTPSSVYLTHKSSLAQSMHASLLSDRGSHKHTFITCTHTPTGKGLLGRTGRQQAASVLTIYGPRTTLVIALPGVSTPRSVQLVLHGDAWEMVHDTLTIAPEGKVFAPGNLRATADNPKYKALVHYWIDGR